MKCLKCDFEEETPYDIIEECWDSGPYPISCCPHCNKPKFVPVDIYNKKKKEQLLALILNITCVHRI